LSLSTFSQGSVQESTEIFEALIESAIRKYLDEKRKSGHNGASRAIQKGSAETDKEDENDVRMALIRQQDDYGNTPLHLAAWNGSKAICNWLIKKGANLEALNGDGLSPVSLTARFGLWDMFSLFRDEHLTIPIWQYGYVKCKEINFSHTDTTRNLQDKLNIELTIQIWREILFKLCHGEKKVATIDKSLDVCEDYTKSGIERALKKLLDDNDKTKLSFGRGTYSQPKRFVSVIEAISLFRPKGWHTAIDDCVEDLVLKKWRKCYSLVYIGQTCVPSLAVFIIFGLMWYWRQIMLMRNSGLPGLYAMPLTSADPEAACGWDAIRDSKSGRIQAVLAVYGALTLIGLAVGQQHILPRELRPSEKDGEQKNILDIVYINLKSAICIITSAMFIAMGAARVMAGPQCDDFYLDAEKNATAFSGLFLFSNLINLLRPVKIFGTTFLSIYQMIVTDLFQYTVVYMSLFLAFLVAIQTIFAANNHYLNNLFDDTLVNSTAYQVLTANVRRKASAGTGSANPLFGQQSMSVDPSLCSASVMSTSDTAFKLLTTSLGDGFGDLLQTARSRPDPACGGYKADYILSILIFAWVVLTNILTMNVLIAMLSKTYEKNVEQSNDTWTLDIMGRVIQYERQFPELLARAHRPTRPNYDFNSVLEDIGLIVYCIPEVHMLARLLLYMPNGALNIPVNSIAFSLL
jgi:hypothetical protein